jgi:8-hydroxy-5-deazaflavin:NADPH oxidoreductase
VFNNIVAESLLNNGRPVGAPGRIALPVAGDSPAARARVMRLVEDLGFDAVDAGSLAESWRQQPGTPAYVQDFDSPRLNAALAAADRSRIPEYRRVANDATAAYWASVIPSESSSQ